MSDPEKPFVTIVMPVRNERAYIEKSLQAVLDQDYPPEKMEILIADGMSNDGTRDLLKQFQAKDFRIRVVDNPEKIVATGLNRAIREAKGKMIIRVDGHCEIAKDYVSQCVRLLRERRVDAVGGPIETIGETLMAKTISVAMSSWFGVGGSAFRTIQDREMLVETVPFPAYPKLLFEKIGYFDEDLVRNQDDEFNYRLKKAGGRILLSPLIRSKYYSRSSLKSLWSQYFQYGFWKVHVMQKHPAQMQVRQFVPALFVASLGILLLLGFLPPGIKPFQILLSLYLAGNLIAALLLSRQSGWRYFLLLPFIFITLHLSYGAGFLKGLWRFSGLWKKTTRKT